MNQEMRFANNPSLLFLQLTVVKAHLILIIRLHAKGAEKHLHAHCFAHQSKNVFCYLAVINRWFLQVITAKTDFPVEGIRQDSREQYRFYAAINGPWLKRI